VTAGAEPARAARRVLRLREVDSTQPVAFALADDGAPDGTVVVTDFQRLGRGRRGHAWIAPPATSVLASIVVRPRVATPMLPLYSFVAAVAVADALEAVAGVDVQLRWPNDVHVGGRKIAGILLESRASAGAGGTAASGMAQVVIGIGVNVRQSAFSGELAGQATSLLLETGREFDRDDVLAAVVDALDRWRARFETEGFPPVRAQWRARALTIGRRVRVEGAEGVAVDLAMDGALVVTDGARTWRINAGEVADVPAGAPGRPSC
jgi:BirA family transcriptional regulator, biotin operon repressor / biotin---[acetyl-CoA-carboxylase] ligase